MMMSYQNQQVKFPFNTKDTSEYFEGTDADANTDTNGECDHLLLLKHNNNNNDDYDNRSNNSRNNYQKSKTSIMTKTGRFNLLTIAVATASTVAVVVTLIVAIIDIGTTTTKTTTKLRFDNHSFGQKLIDSSLLGKSVITLLYQHEDDPTSSNGSNNINDKNNNIVPSKSRYRTKLSSAHNNNKKKNDKKEHRHHHHPEKNKSVDDNQSEKEVECHDDETDEHGNKKKHGDHHHHHHDHHHRIHNKESESKLCDDSNDDVDIDTDTDIDRTVPPSYSSSDESTTQLIALDGTTTGNKVTNEIEKDILSNDEHILISRKTNLVSAQSIVGLQLLQGYPPASQQVQFEKDINAIDWKLVKNDLLQLMKSSQSLWPSDYGHYGPFFIRLAWHSCGSYRTSDGRGGCDGGAQRYDPERSWPDNTNLDKARTLLQPIKLKYGNGLSWGDLIVLAGTVAIESMGGPNIGFCAGRLDVIDNSQTLPLGPSIEQDKFAHCEVNGQCPFPLGSNTIGLIYVNPEGPMGEPDPVGAAATIRDVFNRMDWNGRELVALIGGGHAFGKAHGASFNVSNGVPPNQCPFASWDGPKGVHAITSGIEGPWTSEPTKWDNMYFQNLIQYEWEPVIGVGGKWQWKVKDGTVESPQAPSSDPYDTNGTKQGIMMLTTDIALKVDPEYRMYAEEFASNETALTEAFGKAWYKLVTRDMGPYTRCLGMPATVQKFQYPLPPPPSKKVVLDVKKQIESDLHKLMKKRSSSELDFIRLAYQCASTYRATDYLGGCNGARIRFSPGKEWPINAGLNETIALLEPIKHKYGKKLSYSDLFVLSGNVAAERLGSPKMKFCPGRTDATDGSGWNHIGYGIMDHPSSVDQAMELVQRRGQSYKEYVALSFPRYQSAKKFRAVLLQQLNATTASSGSGTNGYYSDDVFVEGIRFYPELRFWAEHFSSAPTQVYASVFAESWTRLMNADRFDGPIGNLCGSAVF